MYLFKVVKLLFFSIMIFVLSSCQNKKMTSQNIINNNLNIDINKKYGSNIDKLNLSLIITCYQYQKSEDKSKILEEVKLLIEKGADVNIRDKNGVPLLISLLDDAHSPEVIRRQKNKNPVSWTPDLVLLLLEHNVNVKINVQPKAVGLSVLEFAIRGGADVLRRVLDKGAPVEGMTLISGGTPLWLAASSNQYESVQLLIDRGANPNYTNSSGLSVLNVAEQAANRGIGEESLQIIKAAIVKRKSSKHE